MNQVLKKKLDSKVYMNAKMLYAQEDNMSISMRYLESEKIKNQATLIILRFSDIKVLMEKSNFGYLGNTQKVLINHEIIETDDKFNYN